MVPNMDIPPDDFTSLRNKSKKQAIQQLTPVSWYLKARRERYLVGSYQYKQHCPSKQSAYHIVTYFSVETLLVILVKSYMYCKLAYSITIYFLSDYKRECQVSIETYDCIDYHVRKIASLISLHNSIQPVKIDGRR